MINKNSGEKNHGVDVLDSVFRFPHVKNEESLTLIIKCYFSSYIYKIRCTEEQRKTIQRRDSCALDFSLLNLSYMRRHVNTVNISWVAIIVLNYYWH